MWARIEKRIMICGQESDGDGGAGEKKERKTETEVVSQHRERLVGERIVRVGSTRVNSMEASHKKHRPHIKVGHDAEEEEEVLSSSPSLGSRMSRSAASILTCLALSSAR